MMLESLQVLSLCPLTNQSLPRRIVSNQSFLLASSHYISHTIRLCDCPIEVTEEDDSGDLLAMRSHGPPSPLRPTSRHPSARECSAQSRSSSTQKWNAVLIFVGRYGDSRNQYAFLANL